MAVAAPTADEHAPVRRPCAGAWVIGGGCDRLGKKRRRRLALAGAQSLITAFGEVAARRCLRLGTGLSLDLGKPDSASRFRHALWGGWTRRPPRAAGGAAFPAVTPHRS